MTCKLVGLTVDDMELMTIGACLDYAVEYLELKQSDGQEKQRPKIRKATQQDFDAF